MIRVLFICHGNICRSPMAEFVMKKLVSDANLSDHFRIASAATSTEEIWNGIGNPVYPPVKAELARHGISDRYGQCEYPQHVADIRRRSGRESSQAFILCRLGAGHFGSVVHGRVWDDLQ